MSKFAFHVSSPIVESILDNDAVAIPQVNNAVSAWLGTCEVIRGKSNGVKETKIKSKKLKKGSEDTVLVATTAYRESLRLVETGASSPALFKFWHDSVAQLEAIGLGDCVTSAPVELDAWLKKFPIVKSEPESKPESTEKELVK